jgi:PTS system glucitol/sorbitol-specific IIA component
MRGITMKSVITAIGTDAVTQDEPLIILFNETATKLIKTSAVIQKFTDNELFDLKENDSITFGDQVYTINEVGHMSNSQLQELGHSTLLFEEPTEEKLYANGIYLTPTQLPNLEVGMEIVYKGE